MKAPNPETEVTAVVDAIFRRWPSLVGFSVQESQTFPADLVIADVETDPWPAQPRELEGEIAVALLDLMDEEPAARELLRGRTFARTLH
jgi:hypothetical protein